MRSMFFALKFTAEINKEFISNTKEIKSLDKNNF